MTVVGYTRANGHKWSHTRANGHKWSPSLQMVTTICTNGHNGHFSCIKWSQIATFSELVTLSGALTPDILAQPLIFVQVTGTPQLACHNYFQILIVGLKIGCLNFIGVIM